MPYRIVYDPTNRILRARFEGRVTDGELKEVYRLGQKQAARIDPYAGITDFSDVTTVAFSPETIYELAASTPIMRVRAGRLCSWRRLLTSSGWRGGLRY
jgi:hypothetical protein